MWNFIKGLFCKHIELEFIRNFYGDEIIRSNWKRSKWICKTCKKYIYREEYVEEE
jgi:hypothetical protein